MTLFGVLLLLLSAVLCNGYNIKPGPVVIATKGYVWPRPQKQERSDVYLILKPSTFKFFAVNNDCDLLQKALTRYRGILLAAVRRSKQRASSKAGRKAWKMEKEFQGYLNSLHVNLTRPCEDMPSFDMEEAYELRVNGADDPFGIAFLESNSIWGILRGLESFSQLFTRYNREARVLKVNSIIIKDFPRFPHRGLLLDTSRHFIPLDDILTLLDAMEYNKFNVFHWHIVDDHSFPYQSVQFPELSELGAYDPSMVYSPGDIARVIEHARLRGIRVMPEFDTPGHVRSWGVAYPEILTTCYLGDKPNGYLGPLDPSKQTTYDFVNKLFKEVVGVFPEKYVHLGGDEVDFDCWESNAKIRQFMKNEGIPTFAALEEYYIQRLVDMIDKLNASSIVWQEVFDNGVRLPNDTVVHIWTGDQKLKLSQITSKGYPALLSSCWYLDHIANGGDWKKYYECDPHDFPGTDAQKKLVIGGEGCMWSESVDTNNFMQRIWPRASAIAEKLWSAKSVDMKEASERLEEHQCRMNIRGIPAQPANGPGFCVV